MRYDLEYPYAAQAEASERALFIRRTYAHLAGAVLAFTGIEALLLNTIEPQVILKTFLSGGRFGWLAIMIAFMAAGWVARTFAYSRSSQATQYFGLGLYVLLEALIFLPLLVIAQHSTQSPVIPTAAVLTLAVFGGLTTSVFITRKDYSFLAPVLTVGAWIALGIIAAACLFGGFTLGLFFSFAMVALISGYTLYYTSQVMLHFQTDQYVGAALELFSCVATMFWYILRILMSLDRR
jgi:FtsH-binding integral membrane protein